MKIETMLIFYAFTMLEYSLAYYIFFHERTKRNWIVVLIGSIYAVLFLKDIYLPGYKKMVITYAFILVNMLCIMNGKIKSRIAKLFAMFFGISCAEEFFESIIELGMIGREDSVIVENSINYYADMCTLIVLVFFMIIGKSRRNKYIKYLKAFMKKTVMLWLLFMLSGILLTISALTIVREDIHSVRFQIITALLSVISYISVGGIVAFLIYIKNLNDKLEECLQREVQSSQIQLQYYKALLDREEDTRSYRHDMKNHLICLSLLADEGQIDSIKEYLLKMQGEILDLQKKVFDTGNIITDAITNYYLSQINDTVNIKITGKVTMKLDELNLCTIYANLLQNALEELKRIPDNNARQISIQFIQGQQYFRIIIKNSLSEEKHKKSIEEILRSRKGDIRSHGFGIKNIKKSLEEIGGEIKIQKEENLFVAIATIHIK